MAVLAVGPFERVEPLGVPGGIHYLSADVVRYLTECKMTGTDDTKGWGRIQIAKQRAPTHKIDCVEKVSMELGSKKSFRAAGRVRPSMCRYRQKRAQQRKSAVAQTKSDMARMKPARKHAYGTPHVMPNSRSTDVVWGNHEPWPPGVHYSVWAGHPGWWRPW